jgi:hypothetical protein
MANIRVKNNNSYQNLKKYLFLVSGHSGDEENGVKDSLKILLVNHRKCLNVGSICTHMETLLERVKTM